MKKLLFGLVLALIPLVMFGCGSGDYGSGGSSAVTGFASKGPITGGTVKIYEVTSSGGQGSLITTASSPQSGNFTANLGPYKGAIFATMSGGSYTSEATGVKGIPLPQKLHAATYISTSGPLNLAITPLSEVAFRHMSSLTQTRIVNANARVASLYLKGLSPGKDVVNTLPADVSSGSTSTATDPDSINYGLAVATVSQMMVGSSLESAITTLGNALPASPNPNSQLPAAFTTAFAALPAGNLQSGLKNIPLSVTLTPSSTTGIAGTGAKIVLTATVVGFGGAAVADGTTVSFTASAPGVLDNKSATTTKGIATVNLTNASTGQVTVTASAGTVTSSPVTVSFNTDLTAPATVTVSASPASVPADGTTASTITATVNNSATKPLSGVTVSFTAPGGTLSAASGTTDSNGNATVKLTGSTAGAVVTVTASAGSVAGNAKVTFTAPPDPKVPTAVTVSASPTSVLADNSTTSTITANVKNYAGNPPTAVTAVTFAIASGTGTLGTPTTTDANGNATVTLKSGTAGNVTVTATAGAITSSPVTVTFTAPPVRPATATVKVATSGTLASGVTIGAIQADVTFVTTKGLTFTSGVASGAGTTTGTNFLSNNSASGDVTLSLSNLHQVGSAFVGITTGEFATLTFAIPAGTTLPVASDFAVASGAVVSDINGATISGITVIIQGVTLP